MHLFPRTYFYRIAFHRPVPSVKYPDAIEPKPAFHQSGVIRTRLDPVEAHDMLLARRGPEGTVAMVLALTRV